MSASVLSRLLSANPESPAFCYFRNFQQSRVVAPAIAIGTTTPETIVNEKRP